ncbi:putative glucose-6-phosphate 1-epimerase [Diplonema papillatum]|nr:putative glucose-6-phosphate 1-epimerase [Diplonema papillatum]|eukprot:gene18407-28387_t
MTDAETLQKKHGIPERVTFDTKNDFTRMILRTGKAEAEAYVHGAHVTMLSVDGFDVLWLSKQAIYAKGAAIKGGIPICWPQFGPGNLPQHGFLRGSDDWAVEATSSGEDFVEVVFVHTETEKTLAVWPHKFRVRYVVRLTADELETKLIATNTNEKDSFDFTTAFHTYFSVAQIADAQITGLEKVSFVDRVANAELTSDDKPLTIATEVDSVYHNTASELAIDNGRGCKTVVVKSANLPDAVVWNPWVEKAKAQKDFPDLGYLNMVCLEAGAIQAPVTLAAGKDWTASQKMSITRESSAKKQRTA